MKIYTTIKEASFTAKSKASGKVVNFASQQNRDNAIKSGEYEETDGPTADTAPAKPKVNIFDKPKPATQPTSDKDSAEPKAPLKAAPVVKTPVDVLKSKVEKWSDKEKAFFRDGIHKQDSPERRNWKDAIKDKAKGAIAAIKKGAKHEVEEFKTAGGAVKNFFSGKELSEHEKKALKAVAIKVATTAIFGAVTGGAGHGVLAFGKHVAMEFIPHVVGETILKGAGSAALFAGDEDADAEMERFMQIIADKMASEKITPELMTQMVDSYNAKKDEGDTVNEEVRELTPDQSEMVQGIIDMLLQIDDIDNRMKVAQQQIQNFKDEEIIFNYAWFLSAAGLDNNDEPVRMDVKTQPQHIINKESIMIGKINEDFKHIIHVDTPTQVVSKPIAAQILALAKKGIRSKDIGLEMGFVGNAKLATDAFQKVKNKIYFELGNKNESVITEDTKRANILGIDFNISEMNGRIFFSFIDKKAASLKIREIGTNKIVNLIQKSLDNAYGKGEFFFKGGDHAEFQNGYLFQRNLTNVKLNKLKFESVNEAFNVRDLPTWLFDDVDDFEEWYEYGMSLGNGKGKLAPLNSSDDKKIEALVKKWRDAEDDYQHGRGDLGTGKTTGARAASYAAQDAIKQIFRQKGNVVKAESVNEVASRTAMEIGGLTGMNKDAIQKFVDEHNLDIEKVFQFVKKGKLPARMDFMTAVVGKPGNPIQKKIIKMFGESVNEGSHGMATKLLQSIVSGDSSRAEGIKMSKELAQHYIDWIRTSPFGKKNGNLPLAMLVKASFNWGIERGLDSKLKGELSKLKQTTNESVEEATTSSAPGEWVAYLSMTRGKKLLKTFDTARGAKQFLSKNVDKLLGGANVESVGIMTKKQWDVGEAKYAVESVNEAAVKTPDYIVTSISANAIPPVNISKADVGLGLAMFDALGRGWTLNNKDYKLDYHNGKVALVLTKQGKLAVRVKSEHDPKYVEKIEKFANDYLGKYAKDIKKTESVNEEDTKSPEETLASLKQMAMGDLERIEDYAEMISDRMKEGQELSAWMYSQITLAVDQLNAVHDTMDGKDGVKESVNEAKYPTDLKVGSVILGQGFTMLKGIEDGKYYKIVAMDDTSATLVPSDKSGNTKGSKQVRHKLDSIEGGVKTAKRGDENGIVVIKESVNEAMGNDKSMLALVDILSNSMEYYEDDSDFLQAVRGGQGWSGIAGFKNSSLIPVFKSIYKKYWTVSPQNRTNWITKDWINWLKPFGLEENVNSETDTIEETTLNEKQFKGLEGIPANKSLEKISKAEKLNIIKAKGNMISFIVPDEYKGKRNFWQVISTGNIKKSTSGNIVMLMGAGPMNSPSFKNIDDLINGVDWASMERTRRFNESVNEEKPGLWANIRAKKARGGEPAHGNSDAHKDAVKAGKKINNEASTPGEQIQNLNNRLTKLRQDMAKAKSPEAKNVIQAKMKNALQKLSDKKKDMGIKKP